jgi:hypothetical protein
MEVNNVANTAAIAAADNGNADRNVVAENAEDAAAVDMRPGSSFEASEIWRTMANNVPTCLPPGTTDYALTANGQVALVRKPAKDELFLAESVEESRSRWMRLEAEFRGNTNEPHFLTFRDGMQGMELALRTPLTDAARDALVSSWRRLSLRFRTLRGVCDACGGFGHYAKDCRMPRRPRK